MNEDITNAAADHEEAQEQNGNTTPPSEIIEEISIFDVLSKFQRNFILFSISFTVLLLPLSDTMYLPAIHTIARDLNSTNTLVNLSVSIYLLFVSITSLLWGVISDRWGRNITMRIGLLLFTISSILCIFVPNIVGLLILRSFQGATVSVTIVVGQGIIADIYPTHQRGWATGIFFVPFLLGVVLGPTLGGILTYYFSWRSTFIFQAALSIVILIIYVIIIPETHQYKVMVKAVNKKIIESKEILEPQLSNPWSPLKHLIDLTVLPYILAATFAFASVIINQTLVASILANDPYQFNELEIGLCYIPLSISEVLGCLFGGWLADKAERYFRNTKPEVRLVPGTLCFMFIPVGLVIYGWGFEFGNHISYPLLGATLVAFGQAVYRPAVYSYLTIKDQQHAATISAANNFLNFLFAAIGVSIALPVMDVLGIGWFFTIIAGATLVSLLTAAKFTFAGLKSDNKTYQKL